MAHYFRYVPNFAYVSRDSDEQNISDYTAVKNIFKRGKIREDIFGDLQFFEKYQIIGNERPDNVAFKFYEDETLDWVVLLSNNILNIHTEWPLAQSEFDEIMLEKYGDYNTLYNGVHHHETEAIIDSQGITILPAGIELEPTWKTNGNFIEVISNRIKSITSSSVGITTVTLQDGLFGLVEGTQVYISNVTPANFNGNFNVTSTSPLGSQQPTEFTFNLPTPPATLNPTIGGSELAFFTIRNSNNSANSAYYYEYYDSGLGQSVQVPSNKFIKAVTNYEYELNMEEEKRNIYVLKPRYLSVLFDDLESFMPYIKGSSQYVTATLKKGDNIKLYD